MKKLLAVVGIVAGLCGCSVPQHCRPGNEALSDYVCHEEHAVVKAQEKCPQGITSTGECKHDASDFSR